MNTNEKELTGYPSIDKPWLKYYTEGKRDFTIPNCSVYEFMRKNNSDNMDFTALHYFGTNISYRQFISRVDECAKSFVALGIKRGDIVSFVNPTTPEIYYAFYALNKLGAVGNMIDPRTNASRIEEFIFNTDSSIVFYIDISFPKIKDTLNNKKIKKAISISTSDSLGGVAKLVYKAKNKISKNIPENDKFINWKQFVVLGANLNEQYEETSDWIDLPAGIIYTSGTTGIPKGAVISNRNMLAMYFQCDCAEIGWDKKDTFLGIMPPFIAYGLVCGFIVPVCIGMKTVIIPKFVENDFYKYILKYKPNHIMGVPSHIEKLSINPQLNKTDLSFFKTVIVGGDKLNSTLEIQINDFLKKQNSKCKVMKGYGLSEISSCAVLTISDECNKNGSIGVVFIHDNIKVINSDTNEELSYNQVGEICLTGPTMISGYWKNEEENKKEFKNENGEIWVHTGDRGYIDDDGVVFFNDRLKRIIIRSDGHNVWPSDSERVIEKNPYIDGCCVIGIKDKTAEHGDVVTAFIVIKKDCKKTKDEVIKILKRELLNNLPTRDVPYKYYVIDELPLSKVGKVDYRELEKMANEL